MLLFYFFVTLLMIFLEYFQVYENDVFQFSFKS